MYNTFFGKLHRVFAFSVPNFSWQTFVKGWVSFICGYFEKRQSKYFLD